MNDNNTAPADRLLPGARRRFFGPQSEGYVPVNFGFVSTGMVLNRTQKVLCLAHTHSTDNQLTASLFSPGPASRFLHQHVQCVSMRKPEAEDR